ncbi:MAG TPA: DUF294 nucleotidyltransferase-like domain-containing protein, partial [Candidatus Limnocylindrales bacterium]|nr:DUF294 nucleotidyltransferase-like domain-containing protein [Candidatus Limnocylindrales bacterium]
MSPLLLGEQLAETAGILKKVAPFYLLDQNVLESIAAKSMLRNFPKGTYVFRQGDLSLHALFVIISGSAEILILNEQDNEVFVGKRQELEFFGETVFLSEEPYPASVRAEEDLVCCVISHALFETELAHITEFTNAFSRILADRMRTLYNALLFDAGQDRLTIEQPMRQRVASLMSTPPITCRPQDDIAALARQMSTMGISSLVVVSDAGLTLGIITKRDLVEKVLTRDDYSKRMTASDIMSKNLLTVAPEAFYFEALLLMVENKVKHLVVIDNQKLVGIVTIRDLTISRSVGALSIVKSIENQDSLTGLAKASVEIDLVLQALVAERATSREILQIVTEFFDRLTRRVIRVCEQEMIAEGHGLPPVAYGWLTMGSSGRYEQFMKTDQDNAIIYENVPADMEEEVANYFHRLAEKVVDGLCRCGFARCKGNVVASNPFWCRSFDGWRHVINGWINKLEPQNVRMMTIFLDFRHVY